jgi:hypothetical protein
MKSKHKNILIDKKYYIPPKRGNGIVSFYILQDKYGNILEYSLAYINTKYFAKDNGRVIGYDSENGNHHCHRMGSYEKVTFENFDKILQLFETEWREYHDNFK